MIRAALSKLQPWLYKGIKWYYRKPRILIKNGIKIHLLPTVFHPSLYLSTDIFLDYLLTLPIRGKKVLELGAGNGYISLYLSKFQQCQVTASDINPAAIEGLRLSASINDTQLELIASNLFDAIPTQKFDYIVVNPPYYPKTIQSDDEYAFYCGEKLEYFDQFFNQIRPYLDNKSDILMILSETAAIEGIAQKANKQNISMEIVFQQKKRNELFIIYQLKH